METIEITKINFRKATPKLRRTMLLIHREICQLSEGMRASFYNPVHKILTEEFIKKWGLKLKKHRGASGTPILISKKHKVVIKTPFICSYAPKTAIPTLEFEVGPVAGQIHIQPLADVSMKAKKIVAKKLGTENLRCQYGEGKNGEEVGEDAHDNNVGLYLRKPVIIDW